MTRNLALRATLSVVLLAAASATVAQEWPRHRARDDGPQGSERRGDPGGGGFRPPPQSFPPQGYPPPRRQPPPPPPPPGFASPRQDDPGFRPARQLPLGAVIESLQHRAPGHQLDSHMDRFDGRPVYRVQWVTDRGRRMDLIVDAESGAILSER